MSSTLPLHIAVDVRVTPGRSGGLAPAVASLVEALGTLADGPEQYTIAVTTPEQRDWLQPLVGPNQRLVLRPQAAKGKLLRPIRPAIRLVQKLLSPPRFWPEVPLSDGFFESLGCDLVHFPTQNFTVCAVRSVYNPIDLQHLHYPEFFDPWTLAWRETVYRAGCNFAQALIVNSDWIRQDVARQYRVDPAKIHVIPEAPPTEARGELPESRLAELKTQYRLQSPFVLYPAVTWPHKNHLRLFEALAHLRDERGQQIQLVCTGSRHEPFWPTILERIRELKLDAQVSFLGHVPHDDLRGLYRLALCLVLPSLFEANSLPVFEAWREGTPVACANATAIPEQVEDAALLFDPSNPASIADALAALLSASANGDALRARGYERLREFNWQRTARGYRAVYRKTASRHLSEDDRHLLQIARTP